MAKFLNKDVRALLERKTVIVMGDSIQRSVYKDLVCLINQEDSRYLYDVELRAKGEHVFLGDKLLSGGKFLVNSEGKMPNGTDYREVREFRQGTTVFRYYFLTRCFNDHMESILNELKKLQPDVIIMNSCLWDIHHYGPNALEQYNENLPKLFKASESLPYSIFIWNATLPLAKQCKGGFLKPGFRSLPLEDIKKANKYAWQHIANFKRGIYLDLFTEIQKGISVFNQAEDGIHWGMEAHRKISNLILEQIAIKWKRDVPRPPPPQFPMPEDYYDYRNRYNYPLPEYHPQQEWDPMHDFDEQSPDYYNEMASLYYPGMLQQPGSGFPVNYMFHDHPSNFQPSTQTPYWNLHHPYPNWQHSDWEFWGSQNNYAQHQEPYFEPPMKRARFTSPFSVASDSHCSWNRPCFGPQGFPHSQHSETSYRERRFSPLNKQKKQKKGAHMRLKMASRPGSTSNAQFVFKLPNSNDSATAEQNAPVSEGNPSVSGESDVNNNPNPNPQDSVSDKGELGGEPRTGLVEAKYGGKETPESIAVAQESNKSNQSETELAGQLLEAEAISCSSEADVHIPSSVANETATQDTDKKPNTTSPLAKAATNEGKGLKRKRPSDPEQESLPPKFGRISPLFEGFV